MTPEQLASERNKAFHGFRYEVDEPFKMVAVRDSEHRIIATWSYEDSPLAEGENFKLAFFRGWLAAKKDSEQQRKERL